jgi:hypothetical protein
MFYQGIPDFNYRWDVETRISNLAAEKLITRHGGNFEGHNTLHLHF